ncbi:MAG: hypothetical protein OXK16_01195 [bacterium]|nr:hypothetical protein [bacterium]
MSALDLFIGRGRAKKLIPLEDDEIQRRRLGAARRNALSLFSSLLESPA